MTSILGEEEVHFDDDELELERKTKTTFLLGKIASLPSHQSWFDEELFYPMVSEYVTCEIHLRELDRMIMNDPATYLALERIRNNTSGRLKGLRNDLGLTAHKIKQLTPVAQEGTSFHEALAIIDEDFAE